MKLTLNLSALALLAITFFSCQSDSIVNSDLRIDQYYTYTTQPFPYDSVSTMTAIGNNDLLINSNAPYRFVNNISTPIQTNDTSFLFQNLYGLSADYLILTGIKKSYPHKPTVKIFDNGVFTTDEVYGSWDGNAIVTIPYIIEKNKFFAFSGTSSSYSYCNNGDRHDFGMGDKSTMFAGKANNTPYIFGVSPEVNRMNAYKFINDAPQYLWSQIVIAPIGSTGTLLQTNFALSEEIIHVSKYGSEQYGNYFEIEQLANENFRTLYFNTLGEAENIEYVLGKSYLQFIIITTNSEGVYSAYTYDGMNMMKQSNFPANIIKTKVNSLVFSNYYNNTFYMYYNYGSRQLIKAAFNGQ